jgi:hypothetical protein
MPKSLFIEEESYYGFLSRKLQIPPEQVWIFQRRHTPPIIVWGSEGTKIPRAPLLARSAMQIYKFYYSMTIISPIILFDTSKFPMEVSVSINVRLIDPINFIESCQFKKDNRELIEQTVQSALEYALSVRPDKQIHQQEGPLTLSTLASYIYAASQSGIDISQYIQDYQDFRRLGIKVLASVHNIYTKTPYPEWLSSIRKRYMTEIQTITTYLQKVRVNLQEEQGTREELYTSIATEYDDILSTIMPKLKRSLTLHKEREHDDQPFPLAASICKDLIVPQIDNVVSNPDSTIIAERQKEPSMLPTKINTRDAHIEALYEWGSRKNLLLLPELDKVSEFISIYADNESKIELQIPYNYPQSWPIVKVKQNNEPLEQSKVNKHVLPIINAKAYDLIKIVDAAIHTIRQVSGVELENT